MSIQTVYSNVDVTGFYPGTNTALYSVSEKNNISDGTESKNGVYELKIDALPGYSLCAPVTADSNSNISEFTSGRTARLSLEYYIPYSNTNTYNYDNVIGYFGSTPEDVNVSSNVLVMNVVGAWTQAVGEFTYFEFDAVDNPNLDYLAFTWSPYSVRLALTDADDPDDIRYICTENYDQYFYFTNVVVSFVSGYNVTTNYASVDIEPLEISSNDYFFRRPPLITAERTFTRSSEQAPATASQITVRHIGDADHSNFRLYEANTHTGVYQQIESSTTLPYTKSVFTIPNYKYKAAYVQSGIKKGQPYEKVSQVSRAAFTIGDDTF